MPFPRTRREVCFNSRILCCGWCNILLFFFYQKMLEDRGNTAVYLLYAYTRIRYMIVTFCGIYKWELAPGTFLKSFFPHCRAITRNSGVSPESLQEYLQTTPALPLDHPKELKLAKKLIQFDEVLLSVLDSLLLHGICDYVYELSTVFTEFYDVCYCIEKDRQTGAYKPADADFFLEYLDWVECQIKRYSIACTLAFRRQSAAGPQSPSPAVRSHIRRHGPVFFHPRTHACQQDVIPRWFSSFFYCVFSLRSVMMPQTLFYVRSEDFNWGIDKTFHCSLFTVHGAALQVCTENVTNHPLWKGKHRNHKFRYGFYKEISPFSKIYL